MVIFSLYYLVVQGSNLTQYWGYVYEYSDEIYLRIAINSTIMFCVWFIVFLASGLAVFLINYKRSLKRAFVNRLEKDKASIEAEPDRKTPNVTEVALFVIAILAFIILIISSVFYGQACATPTMYILDKTSGYSHYISQKDLLLQWQAFGLTIIIFSLVIFLGAITVLVLRYKFNSPSFKQRRIDKKKRKIEKLEKELKEI